MTIAVTSFLTGAATPASAAVSPDAVPGFASAMEAAFTGPATPLSAAAPPMPTMPPVPPTNPPVLPADDASELTATLDTPAVKVVAGCMVAPEPTPVAADELLLPTPAKPLAPPAPPPTVLPNPSAEVSALSPRSAKAPVPSPEQQVPAMTQKPVAPAVSEAGETEADEVDDEGESVRKEPIGQGVVSLEAASPDAKPPASAIPTALPQAAQPSTVPTEAPSAEAQPRIAAAPPGTRRSSASPASSAPADPSPDARNAAQPAPTFADRLASTTPAAAASAGRPAETPAAARPPQPVVAAQPGRIGREMGVEIARRLSTGGEELTVRLSPVEMGRIEVRLSFDDRGSLRALVSAESAAALDMLRRDSADLGRALADAGVRADAGSFRFDSRSGGESGQFGQRQPAANPFDRRRASPYAGDLAEPDPVYRPLRSSGRVDLMA